MRDHITADQTGPPAVFAKSTSTTHLPMPHTPAGGRLYYPYVDSIRGIAILMVVSFHAFSFTPQTDTQETAMLFLQSLSLGVPLFFVLSGFLISQIVFLQQERFPVKAFAVRRFARIAPPFVASIALYLLLNGSIFNNPLQAGSLVLQNLLTLPNFLGDVRMINPVSWSLFVEIHFYILFPLLFFLFRPLCMKHAGWSTIWVMAIISITFRAWAWNLPIETVADRFFLINRFPNALDYFCWGILYSLLLTENHLSSMYRRADYLTLSGLLLLLGVVGYFTMALSISGAPTHLSRWWLHESVRLGVSAAGFLMLFTTHLSGHGVAFRLFGNKALRYIGIISYEWFLIHLAIIPRVRFHLLEFMGVATDFPNPGGNSTTELMAYLLAIIAGIVVSFIAATMLHKWFSVPLMNLMRKRKHV